MLFNPGYDRSTGNDITYFVPTGSNSHRATWAIFMPDSLGMINATRVRRRSYIM